VKKSTRKIFFSKITYLSSIKLHNIFNHISTFKLKNIFLILISLQFTHLKLIFDSCFSNAFLKPSKQPKAQP